MSGRTVRSARTFPEKLGGFGGVLSDGVDYIVGQAQNAYAAAGAATGNAIADFQNKYAQFVSAYQALKNSQGDAYAVGMGSDYDDLKATFDKVDAMTQAAMQAYSWASNAVSYSANLLNPFNVFSDSSSDVQGLRGLGIAPLVAAAVVAGLVAAIIYALSKFSDYQDKLLALKAKLISEGKLSAGSLDQSFIGDTASLVKWGVIGAVFLLLWGPVIKPQLARLKRHG